VEVIEGAGHWPQWEKPDEFHQAHLRFLSGV
jgi:2-hydroxy-6-oxonona-2,4-dienedioate hydrolase